MKYFKVSLTKGSTWTISFIIDMTSFLPYIKDASDDENNTSALELKMKKREYYRAKLEKINVSE